LAFGLIHSITNFLPKTKNSTCLFYNDIDFVVVAKSDAIDRSIIRTIATPIKDISGIAGVDDGVELSIVFDI
jgi:hypothetical protein